MPIPEIPDPKLTAIFFPGNELKQISQQLKTGFLEGRSVHHLVKASMDKEVKISFDKKNETFLINDNPINFKKSLNLIPFWLRSIVHNLKLRYNSDYKNKFERATEKLANIYCKAQAEVENSASSQAPATDVAPPPQPTLEEKIALIKEEKTKLEENIETLNSDIKNKLSEKLPEKSSEIEQHEAEKQTFEEESEKQQKTLSILIKLKSLLKNEDLIDKGMNTLSNFFKEKLDVSINTENQDNKKKLKEELIKTNSEEITNESLETVVHIDNHIQKTTSNIEKNHGGLTNHQNNLKILKEKYAKERNDKNREIEDCVKELEKQKKMSEENLIQINSQLKELQGEEGASDTLVEKKEEDLDSNTIEKQVKAEVKEEEKLSEADLIVIKEAERTHRILSELSGQEIDFYSNMTKEEQKLYKTICNPLHEEGRNFSFVADLILMLTKDNNPTFSFDPKTKVLSVKTPKEKSGKLPMISVKVPSEMKLQYAENIWNIQKGPKISKVTLKSLEYNTNGEIKINADYNFLINSFVPNEIKEFQKSEEAIQLIFRVKDNLVFS